MPPRLNKRQQRELEELEALGGPSNAQVSSEDEALVVNKPGVAAAFSSVRSFLQSFPIFTNCATTSFLLRKILRKQEKKVREKKGQ